MSKTDVWHDLAERIVERLGVSYLSGGVAPSEVLEMVEDEIKKFVDKRIVRAYFTKK